MTRAGSSFGRIRVAASDPADGNSARETASRALAGQAARFPDLDLRRLDTPGLDQRDAALAHAICDAVLRRWVTLEFLLDTRLDKPMKTLEPALRAVLLGGAAQVLLLDRIPDHAAINESVELAKKLVRPGAAGLTNAVLRGIVRLRGGPRERWTDRRDEIPLSDGRALGLTEAVFPERDATRWSAATGHPLWLIERWRERMDGARVRDLAAHGVAAAPVILNTSVFRGDPILSSVPHSCEGFRVFTGDGGELVGLLGSRRDLWVQDPASAAAVLEAARVVGSPRLIADVCAGKGTKTRQLFHAFPRSGIVATDTDDDRRATLAGVFRDEARVEVVPPAAAAERCRGGADLVLLDVPCSNTGVLARRTEAKYRVSERSIAQLADLQRRIIADAVPLLAPAGFLVYSTCSLEPEENALQVDRAAREHGLTPVTMTTGEPSGLPGGDPAGYNDGSFCAILRR
ncbi:MAG: transcription antitermination factor NusB [Phycisphaerales bacterium]